MMAEWLPPCSLAGAAWCLLPACLAARLAAWLPARVPRWLAWCLAGVLPACRMHVPVPGGLAGCGWSGWLPRCLAVPAGCWLAWLAGCPRPGSVPGCLLPSFPGARLAAWPAGLPGCPAGCLPVPAGCCWRLDVRMTGKGWMSVGGPSK